MNSREKLIKALNHQQLSSPPVDFGATAVTGIHVQAVDRLRKALTGDDSYRVKVVEPYQMLGEIDSVLAEALGVDVVGVLTDGTMFGFKNRNWKPFTLFDGTDVMVPGEFNVTHDANGDLLIYPEGDTSVPPTGRMPKGGNFFDSVSRQEPIDESHLDPADNLEEFGPISNSELQRLAQKATDAASAGMGAIISTPGTSFGDIALVPAMWRKHVKGIRDVAEWYMATAANRDYVYSIFEGQCEIALANLARIIEAVGNKAQVAFTTGTDFGTQAGLFISPRAYRALYQPFHKTINSFIHTNTSWKTFIHSCGAVSQLIPEFIESGFDVLNPVQCSACGMNPATLKRDYGRDIVFWGGCVDTQRTLPFGKPEEVYAEVCERIRIFNKDGGFVFNAVHNIQADTPLENMLAMFRALKDSAE